MRILVWNMSHWQKTQQQRERAWQVIRDLGADVALLQETVPPSGATNLVYREIGGRRNWGSAVVGLTVEVRPVTQARGRESQEPADILTTLPGSVAIATAFVAKRPITLISLYGVIQNGYADTTVNHQLSDLTPLFDTPTTDRSIVLGGDLNITTQWTGSQLRFREREAATLARIRAFGLRDCLDLKRPEGPLDGCHCLDGDGCRHIRTQYHPRSERPWQNDYVFASEALVADGRLKSATAHDDAATRELSDHLPLLVDLAM